MGAFYSIYSFSNKETREPTSILELKPDFRGDFFDLLHGSTSKEFAEKYGLENKDIIFFYAIDISAYDDEAETSRYFDPNEVLNGIDNLIQKIDSDFYDQWKSHFDEISSFLRDCISENFYVQIVVT